MDEMILVDIFDNQIGTGNKEQVHIKGQLHRAFSVFLINGDQMLLQRRSVNKYHSGGLWANACCSHPRNGESFKEAVPRRMREELGIQCETKELFHFVYRTQFSNGVCEYEYDHVFLAEYGKEIFPNPEEIEEIKWVKLDRLEKALSDSPEKFASWFLIAAPRVLEYLLSSASVKLYSDNGK